MDSHEEPDMVPLDPEQYGNSQQENEQLVVDETDSRELECKESDTTEWTLEYFPPITWTKAIALQENLLAGEDVWLQMMHLANVGDIVEVLWVPKEGNMVETSVSPSYEYRLFDRDRRLRTGGSGTLLKESFKSFMLMPSSKRELVRIPFDRESYLFISPLMEPAKVEEFFLRMSVEDKKHIQRIAINRIKHHDKGKLNLRVLTNFPALEKLIIVDESSENDGDLQPLGPSANQKLSFRPASRPFLDRTQSPFDTTDFRLQVQVSLLDINKEARAWRREVVVKVVAVTRNRRLMKTEFPALTNPDLIAKKAAEKEQSEKEQKDREFQKDSTGFASTPGVSDETEGIANVKDDSVEESDHGVAQRFGLMSLANPEVIGFRGDTSQEMDVDPATQKLIEEMDHRADEREKMGKK